MLRAVGWLIVKDKVLGRRTLRKTVSLFAPEILLCRQGISEEKIDKKKKQEYHNAVIIG
jgi:hypothetical protein